jgi:ESS family glutamate:Na+ symporter
MSPSSSPIEVHSFLTATLGILVLFVGKVLNRRIGLLREFTIPEPVSGGLLVAAVLTVLHGLFGLEMEFGMRARDVLLVVFFTTVGINASFADLRRGGRSLLVLLALTIFLMLAQNALGIALARWEGLPGATGLLMGTVSLIGGHGTTIAWAPQIAGEKGVANALEIGIAAATFGLILASASGGPIARFLIRRYRLEGPTATAVAPAATAVAPSTAGGGVRPAAPTSPMLSSDEFLGAVLAINVCIILGTLLQGLIRERGLFLPLFVPCLIVGILVSNLLPRRGANLPFGWPARTPAVALIAEISLGAFLAMSLMTIQVWTLVDLAGPLLLILAAQFVLVLFMTIFLVFPLLGGTYDAAVIAAGFSGFTLGSTPTAMATMTAVTDRFGPAPRAFLILPLVSAFFIDLMNAVLIPFFLRRV